MNNETFNTWNQHGRYKHRLAMRWPHLSVNEIIAIAKYTRGELINVQTDSTKLGRFIQMGPVNGNSTFSWLLLFPNFFNFAGNASLNFFQNLSCLFRRECLRVSSLSVTSGQAMTCLDCLMAFRKESCCCTDHASSGIPGRRRNTILWNRLGASDWNTKSAHSWRRVSSERMNRWHWLRER